MSKMLGCYVDYREEYREYYGRIPFGYVIHHINGNHNDNAKHNLIALPVVVHNGVHKAGFKNLPKRGLLNALAKRYANTKDNEMTRRRIAREVEIDRFHREMLRDIALRLTSKHRRRKK